MNLFDDVYYRLASSFSSIRVDELSHILEINGAKLAQSIDDKALTHFITNSNRFEGWQDIAAREEAGEVSLVTVRIILVYIISSEK
jgi:hypothetical protein